MTYTREQILSANPEELNIMIAECIYRWYRMTLRGLDYDGVPGSGEVLIPPHILDEDEALKMMPPRGNVSLTYFMVKKWSTDISDAWAVVEKMKENNWKIMIDSDNHNNQWFVTFYWDAQKYNPEILGDTIESTICKAALLAVLDL